MNISGALAAIGGYARGKREWMQDVEDKRRWEADLQIRQQMLEMEKQRVAFEGEQVGIERATLEESKSEFLENIKQKVLDRELEQKKAASEDASRIFENWARLVQVDADLAHIDLAVQQLGLNRENVVYGLMESDRTRQQEMKLQKMRDAGASALQLASQEAANTFDLEGREFTLKGEIALRQGDARLAQINKNHADFMAIRGNIAGQLAAGQTLHDEMLLKSVDVRLGKVEVMREQGDFNGAKAELSAIQQDVINMTPSPGGIVKDIQVALTNTDELTRLYAPGGGGIAPVADGEAAKHEKALDAAYWALPGDKQREYFDQIEGYGGIAPQHVKAEALLRLHSPNFVGRRALEQIVGQSGQGFQPFPQARWEMPAWPEAPPVTTGLGSLEELNRQRQAALTAAPEAPWLPPGAEGLLLPGAAEQGATALTGQYRPLIRQRLQGGMPPLAPLQAPWITGGG